MTRCTCWMRINLPSAYRCSHKITSSVRLFIEYIITEKDDIGKEEEKKIQQYKERWGRTRRQPFSFCQPESQVYA